MKIVLYSLAALHLLSGPILAQSYDVDFIGYGQAENFFEPLTGELMVVRSGSTMDRFEGLEETPLEGMTMRCFGATTILNGMTDGSGNCVLTDINGDKILQAWTVDEIGSGSAYGTWHFVGGTGRHEGVRGRGHYSQLTVAATGSKEMSIVGVASWPEQ